MHVRGHMSLYEFFPFDLSLEALKELLNFLVIE